MVFGSQNQSGMLVSIELRGLNDHFPMGSEGLWAGGVWGGAAPGGGEDKGEERG